MPKPTYCAPLALLFAIVLGSPVALAFDDPADGDVSRLLESVAAERTLISQAIESEVDHALRDGRRRMQAEPEAIEWELKLLLERVVTIDELNAQARASLRGELEAGIREAARVSEMHERLDVEVQESRAAALDRLTIVGQLERDEEKLEQLMDRFESLMDERRYASADELGSTVVQEVASDLAIGAEARLEGKLAQQHEVNNELRRLRQAEVVDTLQAVEVSQMPQPDDPPIVFPDADIWSDLSLGRANFRSAADMQSAEPAEVRIRDALQSTTQLEFFETPLAEVVDYLERRHEIPIEIDEPALEQVGLDRDAPVTISISGISLRSSLRLLLGRVELTYIVENEVLLITSVEEATGDRALIRRAYPVADLVIPLPGAPTVGRIMTNRNLNRGNRPGGPNMFNGQPAGNFPGRATR